MVKVNFTMNSNPNYGQLPLAKPLVIKAGTVRSRSLQPAHALFLSADAIAALQSQPLNEICMTRPLLYTGGCWSTHQVTVAWP